MLDRAKVMREISLCSQELFFDFSHEYQQARGAWDMSIKDPLFLQKVQAHPSYNLPTWQGRLDDRHLVLPLTGPYQIVSVDGSQIYPDKHQGTSCFLLNIGTVILRYGKEHAASSFSSEPFLFAEYDIDHETDRSIDVVNGKREEFELQAGLSASSLVQDQYPDLPLLLLFDGSLIFWHLETKEAVIKQYFLKAYFTILEEFYRKYIPIMGYISLPKSKDVVGLLRAQMSDFHPVTSERVQKLLHVVDTGVASFFLEEGQRSTLFASHMPIVQQYPAHLRPWFCYYATQSEMVRIEFPYYVVQDNDLLSRSLSIVADQVKKGSGYPISTAEAHVQAIVKGADREFFYQLLEKQSIDQKRQLLLSQKNLKKRKMSI